MHQDSKSLTLLVPKTELIWPNPRGPSSGVCSEWEVGELQGSIRLLVKDRKFVKEIICLRIGLQF